MSSSNARICILLCCVIYLFGIFYLLNWWQRTPIGDLALVSDKSTTSFNELDVGLDRCSLLDCKSDSWATCKRVDYHYSAADPLYYHVYWRGDIVWMVPLLIKSYLATQPTEISKLILWSPTPLHTQLNYETIKELRDRHPNNIELRLFDMNEMIKGTCMDNNALFDEFLTKIKPQMESDVVRVLLLNRFGGIWVDGDVLFMKNLMPLISFAHEFSSTFQGERMNNHILHIHKNSGTGRKLTESLCHMIQPEHIVKPRISYWLLNDALSLYCNKHLNCNLTGVHRCLTDPQWLFRIPFCKEPKNPANAHSKISKAFILHHRMDSCETVPLYMQRYINITKNKYNRLLG